MINSSKRRQNMRRLLRPRHVCIVGGQAMADSIARCSEAGFDGEIWVVNPKYSELGGRRCYPSVDALPEAPDATFIAVPREATIQILKELDARDAGGAICYAAGFAEVGGEGIKLQEEFITAAGDLAVVGPNCYGILNYRDGITLWPTGHNGKKVETGCALVAQSGNIALNLTYNNRSVPFAYVITSGNQVILNVADFIDILADDQKVTAIGLYIEAISDIPAFSQAAAKALKNGKPLVALKAGKSELGSQLAMSHTSSLAGSDRMYDALFARLGVIRVHSIPDLLETLKLISTAGLPRGKKLAVFTCSGGDGLLTADLAEELGVSLKPHSADQVADLKNQLPNFASVTNPLDYNTSLWSHEDLLTKCFGTVMRGDYDAGMLIIDYATDGEASEQACNASVNAIISACKAHQKMPIVTATLPELLPVKARALIAQNYAAPMQGLPEAMRAFAAAARFADQRSQLNDNGTDKLAIPQTKIQDDSTYLVSESAAKLSLKEYGLVVPESRVVRVNDVTQAATELGFPVVIKVATPIIAHKTEAGAVAINLNSAAEVEAAVIRMQKSVAAYQAGLKVEEVLVETMVKDVVAEIIIGVKRDIQFGLVLIVGAGGVLVEIIEDSALLLLPTERASVQKAISELKITKLLKGYRGKPAGDMESVLDAVMAVAKYAEAHRANLVELDINPLMVTPRAAIAVDALIVQSKP